MIVLNSSEVIDMIDSAISDYNSDIYNHYSTFEEIEAHSLPLYDEDNGISEEVLGKLKNFKIVLKRYSSQSEKDKYDIEGDLLSVISNMKLSSFSLHYLQKAGEKPENALELTKKLLDIAGTELDTLNIRGVDLSEATPDMLPNYGHLKTVTFGKCKLSNPSLIENLPNDTTINFESIEKDIGVDNQNEFVDEIFKRNGKFRVQGEKFDDIPSAIIALKSGNITLSQYELLKDRFDFSKIVDLKITLDPAFDLDREDLEEIIESINSLSNAKFIAPLDRYRKINEKEEVTLPTQLNIKDASEMGVNDLEEYPFVESISIVSQYTAKEQQTPYSIDDYKLVRGKIDEIISKIPDGATEREKFAYIYNELGRRIDYNFYATTKDGKKDEKLQTTCRNLYDGLIRGEAVCAGYADILFNTLACANVESRYISGIRDFEGGAVIRIDKDNNWEMEPRSCMESSKT